MIQREILILAMPTSGRHFDFCKSASPARFQLDALQRHMRDATMILQLKLTIFSTPTRRKRPLIAFITSYKRLRYGGWLALHYSSAHARLPRPTL